MRMRQARSSAFAGARARNRRTASGPNPARRARRLASGSPTTNSRGIGTCAARNSRKRFVRSGRSRRAFRRTTGRSLACTVGQSRASELTSLHENALAKRIGLPSTVERALEKAAGIGCGGIHRRTCDRGRHAVRGADCKRERAIGLDRFKAGQVHDSDGGAARLGARQQGRACGLSADDQLAVSAHRPGQRLGARVRTLADVLEMIGPHIGDDRCRRLDQMALARKDEFRPDRHAFDHDRVGAKLRGAGDKACLLAHRCRAAARPGFLAAIGQDQPWLCAGRLGDHASPAGAQSGGDQARCRRFAARAGDVDAHRYRAQRAAMPPCHDALPKYAAGKRQERDRKQPGVGDDARPKVGRSQGSAASASLHSVRAAQPPANSSCSGFLRLMTLSITVSGILPVLAMPANIPSASLSSRMIS